MARRRRGDGVGGLVLSALYPVRSLCGGLGRTRTHAREAEGEKENEEASGGSSCPVSSSPSAEDARAVLIEKCLNIDRRHATAQLVASLLFLPLFPVLGFPLTLLSSLLYVMGKCETM